jgi:hypothetical protein
MNLWDGVNLALNAVNLGWNTKQEFDIKTVDAAVESATMSPVSKVLDSVVSLATIGAVGLGLVWAVKYVKKQDINIIPSRN